MLTDIKSREVQEVNRLRTRSYRESSGLVIVEGLPEVSRAVKAKVDIKVLYICRGLLEVNDRDYENLNVVEVSKDVFAEMAFGSRLKGILALCKPTIYDLSDMELTEKPFFVVMENVEKPGNLGAVIRSCDGAGLDSIIMCDGKTDIYNHHVVRSSIGTIFSVKTIGTNQNELYEFLSKNNIKIYAATAKENNVYTDIDFTQGSCVILGNEHSGVSDFWLERCDQTITIPMLGQASSLNVTVSASIFIFEANRQRGRV